MNFKLETKIRKTGKQSMLTEIRTSSRVPGVVYGFKKDPVNIDMDYNTLLKVLKEAGTSNVIDIQVDGKSIPAIVREYQQDPVTDKLTHIDFMAVDAKRTLTTVVPLEFVGTSKVVREQGGKLEIKNQQVNVQCLPDDLPATIEVDVSLLKEMGQILSISTKIIGEIEVPYTSEVKYNGIPYYVISFNQKVPNPVKFGLSSANTEKLTYSEILDIISNPPIEEIQ